MIKPFLEQKREKVDFSEGKKLKAIILVSIFLSLFLINFTSAAPTKFSGTSVTGIDIEHPYINPYLCGEDLKFHFHLFNSSTGGQLLANRTLITCSFHLYNITGAHVFKNNYLVGSDDVLDYEQIIGKGNITNCYYEYAYVFQCNTSSTSATPGGYYENNFRLSTSGNYLDTPQVIGSSIYLILMIILMFTFGIVGFKLFQNKYLWILGLFLVILASFLLIYSSWLGYEYYNYLTGLPVSNMPETIFYVFLFIIGSGLLTSLVLLFLHWKEVFRYIKREIKKNDSDDKDIEDWDFDS